jgi:integrase
VTDAQLGAVSTLLGVGDNLRGMADCLEGQANLFSGISLARIATSAAAMVFWRLELDIGSGERVRRNVAIQLRGTADRGRMVGRERHPEAYRSEDQDRQAFLAWGTRHGFAPAKVARAYDRVQQWAVGREVPNEMTLIRGLILLSPRLGRLDDSAVQVHRAEQHSDVTAWISELSGGLLAPATVRYVYRVFMLLLDAAVKDGLLYRNPGVGVRLPKVSASEKRFLTAQQVDDLADAAGSYRLVILTLAYCGIRWGEMAALRVGKVDPVRGRLEIDDAVTEVKGHLEWGAPKSHQRRSVPMPRFLADDLARHIAHKQPEDLVFVGIRGGVLRNLNFRRDVFDDAAEAAGLNGLTPHELRHTAASLAVASGANVKSVQRMLGHASAAMTLDVYSGLFDDDLDAVAERMDEVGRAAVAPLLPQAEVIDLDEVRRKAGKPTITGLEDGAALEIRTPDLRITSALLYQLS